MSIVEHIQELRRRLFISLAAIAVGTVVGYIWYGNKIGPVPSLGEMFIWPYCSLPPEVRFGSSNGECSLLAIGIFEQFALRLKVGALAGLVFSSPVWLLQIWSYITPGLKKNEKKWSLLVSGAAGSLFFLGAILAFLVLSQGLNFLLTIGKGTQVAALTGEKYFSFAIGLLLVFGVSFEVPLITVLLNVAGLISYQQLKEKRRYIFVFLFVFAAFITPGQDPISMVILSLSLCLMMEIATQIARINDRRRKAKNEKWLGVGDDEASDIEAAAPIDVDNMDIGPTRTIPDPTPAPQSRSGARPTTSEYPRNTNNGPDSKQGGSSYFDDVL